MEVPAGRPSPPTDRVLQLIDVLASHPRQRYSLADLVRITGMSQATCIAVLATLVRAGYLTRDQRDRTYALGPALVAAGRAAEEAMADLDDVRRGLAGLSQRFGVVGTASTVIDDRIAVLERTGRSPQLDDLLRPGQRYPFRPPLGLMFAAWDTDDTIRRWLARAPDRRLVPDQHRVWDAVARCRRRGYLIEQLSGTALKLQRAIVGLPDDGLSAEVIELLSDVALALAAQGFVADEPVPEKPDTVMLIGAPVFDRDGRPKLVLMLYVLGDEQPGVDPVGLASALRSTAEELSLRAGGADPWVSATKGVS